MNSVLPVETTNRASGSIRVGFEGQARRDDFERDSPKEVHTEIRWMSPEMVGPHDNFNSPSRRERRHQRIRSRKSTGPANLSPASVERLQEELGDGMNGLREDERHVSFSAVLKADTAMEDDVPLTTETNHDSRERLRSRRKTPVVRLSNEDIAYLTAETS